MRGVWIPAFAGIQNSKMTKTSRNLYPGKQTERECLTKREKETTINGALRLAAKRHENAEPVFNLDRVPVFARVRPRYVLFPVVLFLILFMNTVNAKCQFVAEQKIIRLTLNAEYPAALEAITGLEEINAAIPSATFYQSLVKWHEAYQRKDSRNKKSALNTLRKSIGTLEKAEAIYAGNRLKQHLALALAKGHTARALMEDEQYYKGYRLGIQAKFHVSRYLELADADTPGFHDVNFLRGLYEIYTHDLLIREYWWIGTIDYRGDRQLGIELIENAISHQAIFSADAIRALLAEVSWRTPDFCRYANMIDQTGEQFPGNNDISILRQGLLLKCGHTSTAEVANEKYHKELERHPAKYSTSYKNQLAKARFRIAADSGNPDMLRDRQLSELVYFQRLAKANALDVAGNRNAALSEYRSLVEQSTTPTPVKAASRVRIRFPYQTPKRIEIPQFESTVVENCHNIRG